MIRVVEFETRYRVGKEPVDYVKIAPAGPAFEKTQTWHAVEKIRPPANADDNMRESLSYLNMLAKWEVIGPAYEAWRAGQEMPENGTPLAAWSGVTADQAQALRAMGIRTVEDVRDMGEAAMTQLRFPSARQLPKLAADYLEGRELAEKDAENAELRERLAALEEMIDANKPKRGRPRKTEAEAA